MGCSHKYGHSDYNYCSTCGKIDAEVLACRFCGKLTRIKRKCDCKRK